MKTRNGFVSNSSSTSFIVAIDKTLPKAKIVMEIDLSNYGDVIETVEELDDCWELAGDDDGDFDMDDRIDFIFVSDDLSDDVEECNYLGGINSDHPAVSIEIDV